MKVRSPIRYYGGKFFFDFSPFPEHRTYIEPFGGSIVTLLNKPKVKSEIVNDVNSLLINFWMKLRDNYSELMKALDFLPKSEQLFKQYMKDLNEKEIELDFEAAKKFFYINRHCQSGFMCSYMGMNTGNTGNYKNTVISKLQFFKSIWERIKDVDFRCRDFRLILNPKIDHEWVLLYLDPPYVKGGKEYQKMVGMGKNKWTQKDLEDLRKIIKDYKNLKFILSIDDADFFSDPNWFVQEIDYEKKASAAGIERKTYKEYIIRNFDIDKIEINNIEDVLDE